MGDGLREKQSAKSLKASKSRILRYKSTNPYIIFLMEYISIPENKRGLSNKQLFTKAGEVWRKLSPAEKAPYIKAANEYKRLASCNNRSNSRLNTSATRSNVHLPDPTLHPNEHNGENKRKTTSTSSVDGRTKRLKQEDCAAASGSAGSARGRSHGTGEGNKNHRSTGNYSTRSVSSNDSSSESCEEST